MNDSSSSSTPVPDIIGNAFHWCKMLTEVELYYGCLSIEQMRAGNESYCWFSRNLLNFWLVTECLRRLSQSYRDVSLLHPWSLTVIGTSVVQGFFIWSEKSQMSITIDFISYRLGVNATLAPDLVTGKVSSIWRAAKGTTLRWKNKIWRQDQGSRRIQGFIKHGSIGIRGLSCRGLKQRALPLLVGKKLSPGHYCKEEVFDNSLTASPIYFVFHVRLIWGLISSSGCQHCYLVKCLTIRPFQSMPLWCLPNQVSHTSVRTEHILTGLPSRCSHSGRILKRPAARGFSRGLILEVRIQMKSSLAEGNFVRQTWIHCWKSRAS